MKSIQLLQDILGVLKDIRADLQTPKNFQPPTDEIEKNLHVEYEEKLKAANRKISELEKDIETLRGDVKKISADRDTANNIANFYHESYSELDEIYKLYLTLDEDTRYNLAGIFGKGDTATEFFSGAVQESHINSFWDYIARHNDEKLQKIFDFAFKMYNKGFRDAPYKRLEISQGERFDDEFMRRTPSSRQLGEVKRVLFQGYKYSNGNVIKPSIVELS